MALADFNISGRDSKGLERVRLIIIGHSSGPSLGPSLGPSIGPSLNSSAGPSAEQPKTYLDSIGESLCDTYGLKWQAAPSISIPSGSFVQRRSQYNAEAFLRTLKAHAADGEAVLGIANVDLYIPYLSFVFGLAHAPSKTAVISLTRLDEGFYRRRANKKLFVLRAVKEAVHEIGHLLNLKHCNNPDCIMFFSNDIEDTDRKRPSPCKNCNQSIALVRY